MLHLPPFHHTRALPSLTRRMGFFSIDWHYIAACLLLLSYVAAIIVTAEAVHHACQRERQHSEQPAN